MAILAVFDAPNMTKKQYDELRPIVKWETVHPDGAVLHSCAFDEQGGLHVVDVWESEAQLSQFFETRLMAGFRKLGIEPPQGKTYPLHNLNVFGLAEDYRAKSK